MNQNRRTLLFLRCTFLAMHLLRCSINQASACVLLGRTDPTAGTRCDLAVLPYSSFLLVSVASAFDRLLHHVSNRSLPSPVPAQPILQQPKSKRALPTWSRNKTCLHKGRSKALTPEPGKSILSKLMGEPSGDRIGADLFGSGGAAEVRLHGSYPRLIGADSDVVLWDLRKAQQALADIQHKLANREVRVDMFPKTPVWRAVRDLR